MNRVQPRQMPRYRRRANAQGAASAFLGAISIPFSATTALPGLAASFAQATQALGFPYHMVTRITRAPPAARPAPDMQIVCGHYPPDWVQHYQQHGYAAVDPVHRAAFCLARPYRWRELAALSAREQRVLDEAAESGLPDGISVPIHEPDGTTLLVNLAGPVQLASAASRQQLAWLLSTQLHFELQQLMCGLPDGAPVTLTPRQRECLTWVARGKSSWTIAKLLQLSRHTVEYHLTGAMRALGVNSRTAAAVRAAVLGLIRL